MQIPISNFPGMDLRCLRFSVFSQALDFQDDTTVDRAARWLAQYRGLPSGPTQLVRSQENHWLLIVGIHIQKGYYQSIHIHHRLVKEYDDYRDVLACLCVARDQNWRLTEKEYAAIKIEMLGY